MAINLKNIAKLLVEKFAGLAEEPITQEEEGIAKHIQSILRGIADRNETVIEEELVFDDGDEGDEGGEDDEADEGEVEVGSGEDAAHGEDEDDDRRKDVDYEKDEYIGDHNIPFEYKKKCVEYMYTANGNKRSLKSLMHRYRRLKSSAQLHRWKKTVEMGGSNRDKSKKLSRLVLDRFVETRLANGKVHDNDIRRWALEKGAEVGLPTFQASNSWVIRFKKQNKIVLRKIPKDLSRRDVAN